MDPTSRARHQPSPSPALPGLGLALREMGCRVASGPQCLVGGMSIPLESGSPAGPTAAQEPGLHMAQSSPTAQCTDLKPGGAADDRNPRGAIQEHARQDRVRKKRKGHPWRGALTPLGRCVGLYTLHQKHLQNSHYREASSP